MESGTSERPTALFSDLTVARWFRVSPMEWAGMTRVDRKILCYMRAQQQVYEDTAQTQRELERATEQAQAKARARRR